MSSELKEPGFHKRLAKVIGDETPFGWAARVGISKGAFSRIWNEGTIPGSEHLKRIAENTDVSIDWLLIGEGDMYRGKPSRDGVIIAEGATDYEFLRQFVLVPRYEVSASAGGGAVIHSEQIVDYLSFRTDWIRNNLGLSEKHLALINVLGDSMETTLSNGDLILVDLRTNRVVDNSVYVLKLNGSLIVKRIQRKLDGSVVVKSDNNKYEPETVSGDMLEGLNIVGRVVWCGRRM